MQLLKLSIYILLSICVCFADDCGQYSSESDCTTDANNYGCIWDSSAGSNGECHKEDDGPPECLMTCEQGFETLSENSTEEDELKKKN